MGWVGSVRYALYAGPLPIGFDKHSDVRLLETQTHTRAVFTGSQVSLRCRK